MRGDGLLWNELTAWNGAIFCINVKMYTIQGLTLFYARFWKHWHQFEFCQPLLRNSILCDAKNLHILLRYLHHLRFYVGQAL